MSQVQNISLGTYNMRTVRYLPVLLQPGAATAELLSFCRDCCVHTALPLAQQNCTAFLKRYRGHLCLPKTRWSFLL